MLLAHKIALDPNAAQRMYFARAAGIARFAYNWALGEWQRKYKAGGKPSEVSLRRQLNAVKRENFPWMYDVTKCAVQEAIIDLGASFRAFFEKRGEYPRFKKEGERASSAPPTRPAHSAPTASGSSCRLSAGCECARRCASPGR